MFKWKDTEEDMIKRIQKLEIKLLQTSQCQSIDRKMDAIFNEIKQYLPEDKKHLVIDVEDCFIEGLILYEEYFYKNGSMDNAGISRQFLSWLKRFKRG